MDDKNKNNKLKPIIAMTVIFLIFVAIGVITYVVLDTNQTGIIDVFFIIEMIVGTIGSFVPFIAVLFIILAVAKKSDINKKDGESEQKQQEGDVFSQQTSKKMPKMIRCKYCRSLVGDDEDTCKYCGAKLEK